MNVAELRTLTAGNCEDPNITKFTAIKYLDSLNKAAVQFAMDGKGLYKKVSFVMVAGTQSYDLPTNYIQDKSVTLNGLPLDPISKDKLAENHRITRWDTRTGQPTHYISDPAEDTKKLTLYPIPDSISSGADLVLTYNVLPTVMTADSDIPLNASLLMVQFHPALAWYAAWMLLGFVTQTPEIVTKRNGLISQYTEKVNECIQTFGISKSAPLSFHPASVRIR